MLPVPSPSKHPLVAASPGIRVKCLDTSQETALENKQHRVWVDVEHPMEADLQRLSKYFRFNRLALEDALDPEQWARFEVYPEHLFLVLRTLAEPEDVTDRTEKVAIFWYPEQESVITIRHEPITYLDGTWRELENRKGISATDVLYTILDEGTDTFFTFLDELETRTDDLEEQVFHPTKVMPSQEFAARVFELKHTIIAARRLASSARENVAQFSRHATALSPEGAIYLRDVSDHLTRIYDGIDSARDVLSSLLDVHLTVQSNRMNEVMKTLTTVSTIFLPLTFLAGVWGMNYVYIPELHWRYGYAFAWGSFILAALAFAAYFKWRKWW
jgi:magnesium transporter